jgi:hypothetical protein
VVTNTHIPNTTESDHETNSTESESATKCPGHAKEDDYKWYAFHVG